MKSIFRLFAYDIANLSNANVERIPKEEENVSGIAEISQINRTNVPMSKTDLFAKSESRLADYWK